VEQLSAHTGHRRQEVRFGLDADGRLLPLRMKRRGDPDGSGHRPVDFGGDGEFFGVVIEHAVFR